MVKDPPTNTGDTGMNPALRGSPGRENGNPHQYSWLEKSHGQKTLMGHSSWGHKESDTTEKLNVHASKT